MQIVNSRELLRAHCLDYSVGSPVSMHVVDRVHCPNKSGQPTNYGDLQNQTNNASENLSLHHE